MQDQFCPSRQALVFQLVYVLDFAGLIEIREFMVRFVDQAPGLDDLEAAFADPTKAQQHMEVLQAF